jgi:ATP-dependent DNA helicase RecG
LEGEEFCARGASAFGGDSRLPAGRLAGAFSKISMLTLQTSVEQLLRIGKTTAKRLRKLGLETAKDLLFYFPFRHEDWSQVVPINKLTYGSVATCRGKIELIKNTRSFYRRKNITEALVSDDSGSIKVVWFSQPYLVKILKSGDEIFLSGKVDFDRFGLHLTSPSYEKVPVAGETTHTARIVPIYSSTENLTQKQLRFLAKLVVPLANHIQDWLPAEIKNSARLVDLKIALRQVHFPDSKQKLDQAKRRLKFDELFLIQLRNALLKINLQKIKAAKIKFKENETKKFTSSLPFKLTNAQRRAAWEILQDLEKSQPMNRLLEGDVGSGKTVVAAIAILNTVLNGYRAVVMAPTEILAKQHYNTFTRLFAPFDIVVGILTHSYRQTNMFKNPKSEIQNPKQIQNSKSQMIKQINDGKVHLIIGTHALIQEGVRFDNLGLAIVDEQHRFGVEQRKALRSDGGERGPHFLSMTATPIPRTMSLIFYGDLDLSIIDELPADRKKIITKVVAPEKRQAAYDFIKKEIKSGRQAFVICPLIDPSDKLGVKSAQDEHKKLGQDIFSDFKIGLLHGKMKAEKKEETMQDFLKNKINILVSTSVVEVGVDAPNATIMIIEGAERFGLAQLHQFRGRVGRSNFQSYCLLFFESENQEAAERLHTLVNCENGFVLAEKDLAQRGPGEIFGTRQHGLPDLKAATLNDYQIAKEAKEAAEKLIQKDPEFLNYPDIKEKIEEFEKRVHLE